MEKVYLGDAVYFDFDGYHVVLTTEDGISTTNRICLEPQVIASFQIALSKLVKELENKKQL